ncbi:unnamed protein product [Closterium sp. NIES-54]
MSRIEASQASHDAVSSGALITVRDLTMSATPRSSAMRCRVAPPWPLRRADAAARLLLCAALALTATADCSFSSANHPLPRPQAPRRRNQRAPPSLLARPTRAQRALLKLNAATAAAAADFEATDSGDHAAARPVAAREVHAGTPHALRCSSDSLPSLSLFGRSLHVRSERGGAGAAGVGRVGGQQQRHHCLLCVAWRHVQPQRTHRRIVRALASLPQHCPPLPSIAPHDHSHCSPLYDHFIAYNATPPLIAVHHLDSKAVSVDHGSAAIPDSITNLAALQYLDLTNDQLAGPIPSLASLTSLTLLAMGADGSQLTGTIEGLAWLSSLSNLHTLNLFGLSEFTGDLSSLHILSHLEKLQSLTLSSFTNATGEIPREIRYLTALTALDLSYLRALEFPDWVTHLTTLQHLNVNADEPRRQGLLSDDISHLTALTSLSLKGNNLEGYVPKTCSSLLNLQYLMHVASLTNSFRPLHSHHLVSTSALSPSRFDLCTLTISFRPLHSHHLVSHACLALFVMRCTRRSFCPPPTAETSHGIICLLPSPMPSPPTSRACTSSPHLDILHRASPLSLNLQPPNLPSLLSSSSSVDPHAPLSPSLASTPPLHSSSVVVFSDSSRGSAHHLHPPHRHEYAVRLTHVPASLMPASLMPASLVPASPVPASPVPASPVPASPVPASPVPASPVPASPVPASQGREQQQSECRLGCGGADDMAH